MVNLSPTAESYFESLCSLRFASQVNQCELGKPKRNIKDIMQGSSTSSLSSVSAPTSSSSASASNSSSQSLAKSTVSSVTSHKQPSNVPSSAVKKVARLK